MDRGERARGERKGREGREGGREERGRGIGAKRRERRAEEDRDTYLPLSQLPLQVEIQYVDGKVLLIFLFLKYK